MIVIQTAKLSKEYHLNGLSISALNSVDLNFEKGEFSSIAGPSGSGKSTFLHLIGCLDTPTSGSISVCGKDTAQLDKKSLALLRRKSIGFVFQAYNLIPVLSTIENISFPLVLLGYSARESNELARNMLYRVGLEGMENRRPKEMSGGQQQRVAIARALVKQPELVLADEPTANLDSATAREILELMLTLNQNEGVTFVFSTHDQLVLEYARRIVRLRDGAIESEEHR